MPDNKWAHLDFDDEKPSLKDVLRYINGEFMRKLYQREMQDFKNRLTDQVNQFFKRKYPHLAPAERDRLVAVEMKEYFEPEPGRRYLLNALHTKMQKANRTRFTERDAEIIRLRFEQGLRFFKAIKEKIKDRWPQTTLKAIQKVIYDHKRRTTE